VYWFNYKKQTWWSYNPTFLLWSRDNNGDMFIVVTLRNACGGRNLIRVDRFIYVSTCPRVPRVDICTSASYYVTLTTWWFIIVHVSRIYHAVAFHESEKFTVYRYISIQRKLRKDEIVRRPLRIVITALRWIKRERDNEISRSRFIYLLWKIAVILVHTSPSRVRTYVRSRATARFRKNEVEDTK